MEKNESPTEKDCIPSASADGTHTLDNQGYFLHGDVVALPLGWAPCDLPGPGPHGIWVPGPTQGYFQAIYPADKHQVKIDNGGPKSAFSLQPAKESHGGLNKSKDTSGPNDTHEGLENKRRRTKW